MDELLELFLTYGIVYIIFAILGIVILFLSVMHPFYFLVRNLSKFFYQQCGKSGKVSNKSEESKEESKTEEKKDDEDAPASACCQSLIIAQVCAVILTLIIFIAPFAIANVVLGILGIYWLMAGVVSVYFFVFMYMMLSHPMRKYYTSRHTMAAQFLCVFFLLGSLFNLGVDQFYSFSLASLTVNFFCLIYVAYAGQPSISLKKLLIKLFAPEQSEDPEEATASKDETAAPRGSTRPNNIYLLIAYGISIVVLVAYAWTYSTQPYVGKYARYSVWWIIISILWYDLFVFALKSKRFLRNDPEQILFVEFFCRGTLIAFGTRYWFLGQCVLYVIFTWFLGKSMVEHFYPKEGMSARVRAFEDASDIALSDGNVQIKKEDSENENKFASKFVQNTLLYIMCSAPFIIVLILVSTGVMWAPRVSILDTKHQQSDYGWASVFASFGGLLGYATWRAFLRGTTHGTGTKPLHMAFLSIQGTLFWVSLAVAGIIMHALTKSVYLIAGGIFIPPILMSLAFFVRTWKLNHYSYFKTGSTKLGTAEKTEAVEAAKKAREMETKTETKEEETKSLNNNDEPPAAPPGPPADDASDNGDVENPTVSTVDVKADMAAGNDKGKDESSAAAAAENEPCFKTEEDKYNFLVCMNLFLMVACTVSFGVWIMAEESILSGLFILFVPMILFTTIIPIVTYFETEEFDKSYIIQGAISLVLLVIFTILIAEEMTFLEFTSKEMTLTIIFVILAYPSIAAVLLAITVFRAENGKLNNLTMGLSAFAFIAVLSFDIVIAVVYSVVGGIALIVAFFLFLYLCYVGYRWYTNDYRLPKKLQISVAVIGIVIIAAGIIIGLVQKSGFYGFSLAWLVFCSLLCGHGLNQLVNTSKTHTAFSARFFPVYKFEIDTGNIKPKNFAALLGLAGLYGVAVYGAVACYYLSKPAVGVAISCTALCSIAGLYFYLVHAGPATLALTSEYLTKKIVLGLKDKAFQKYKTVSDEDNDDDVEAQNSSGNDDEIFPEMQYPIAKKIMLEMQAKLFKTEDKDVNELITYEMNYLRFMKAELNMFKAFKFDTDFTVYYELLLIMAGRYLMRRMERDIVEFLVKNNLKGVTVDDIRNWKPEVLAKLKKELDAKAGATAERIRIIEEQEAQANKGKRGRINVTCNTVFPLVNDDDLTDIRKKVAQEVGNFKAVGNQFEDADFPPYAVRGQYDNWRRPTEITNDKKVQLFDDKIEPADLNQGSLGDCWFIAAMANVAQRPEIIRKLFIEGSGEHKYSFEEATAAGVYAVKFHQQGRWWGVVIDDRMPANQWGSDFAFAKSKNEDAIEMWPPVLEKAYAKLFSSENGYEQLEGGLVTGGMTSLTGFDGITYRHKTTSERVISGRLWSDIKRMHAAGFFIGAGSAGESDSNVSSGNIVERHAFSILNVAEIEGFKLIQLRNPWGQTEWTGDWSDESPMWDQYPKVKKALNVSVADDGIFWMLYEDYLRHYDQTGVTLFSKSGEIVTKTIKYEECPPGYEEGMSYGPQMENSPQAWLKVDKSMDLLIRINTPPRRQVDDDAKTEDGSKDSGDWLQVVCCQDGEVRLHSVARSGRMLNIFNKSSESCLVFAAGSDVAYNIICCWSKFSKPKQELQYIFPLEISIQCRKEDADFVTLTKTPLAGDGVTVAAAESENLWTISSRND